MVCCTEFNHLSNVCAVDFSLFLFHSHLLLRKQKEFFAHWTSMFWLDFIFKVIIFEVFLLIWLLVSNCYSDNNVFKKFVFADVSWKAYKLSLIISWKGGKAKCGRQADLLEGYKKIKVEAGQMQVLIVSRYGFFWTVSPQVNWCLVDIKLHVLFLNLSEVA